MSTKAWAPECQAAAALLIAAGWTPAMTGAALGVSAQTAQTWARRELQPPPTDPRARRAIAIRLHEHHWPFAKIAQRLGVSVRYVSRLCSWTRLADAGPAEDPPAAPAAPPEATSPSIEGPELPTVQPPADEPTGASAAVGEQGGT